MKLWHSLVGLLLVLNSSGHKWYVDDGPHLGHADLDGISPMGYQVTEQARLVKTVKVR